MLPKPIIETFLHNKNRVTQLQADSAMKSLDYNQMYVSDLDQG